MTITEVQLSLEGYQKAFRALVVTGIVALVNLPLVELDKFFVPSLLLQFSLFFALAGFLLFLALKVLPLRFG
ncbi:MAG: hypothetical protein M3Y27_29795 [Acidobacteriota bacterium]|nr:hypothetical protein [Acidobacteriota bacterium]